MIFNPPRTLYIGVYVVFFFVSFGISLFVSPVVSVVYVIAMLLHMALWPAVSEVEVRLDLFIVRKSLPIGYTWQKTFDINVLEFKLVSIRLSRQTLIKSLLVYNESEKLYEFISGSNGWDDKLLEELYREAHLTKVGWYERKEESELWQVANNITIDVLKGELRYLSAFKAKIDEHHLMYIPATPKEIYDTEMQMGKSFPLAYKEFLLIAGSEIERLDLSEYQLSRLISLNAYADKLLVRNGFAPLGKSGIAIEMHQGYSFYYFKDISIENPEVYLFVEGDAPVVNMLRFNSFTEYLIYKYNTMYERPEESFH